MLRCPDEVLMQVLLEGNATVNDAGLQPDFFTRSWPCFFNYMDLGIAHYRSLYQEQSVSVINTNQHYFIFQSAAKYFTFTEEATYCFQ